MATKISFEEAEVRIAARGIGFGSLTAYCGDVGIRRPGI